MKTKNGIELNLKESSYSYNYLGLTFYFSSEFYRNKFIENVRSYISQETLKLELKYRVNLDIDVYLAVAYYKKIDYKLKKINCIYLILLNIVNKKKK